jgi:hypothetical protein
VPFAADLAHHFLRIRCLAAAGLTRLMYFIVVGLALGALGACGNEIGDSCKTNIDCSVEGTRPCDISQPGGYCTIEGCSLTSCPDEAMCVRFFPAKFLSQPCDPRTEDVSSNDCSADEICLEGGLCSPRSTERRYCALRCGNNGDCRGGYECRLVGEHGSSSLNAKDLGKAKFCAPKEPT